MSENRPRDRYDLSSRRKRFLGVDKDGALKGLFGGNALVSLIVLTLITVFLFREGVGFFGQYRASLDLYRASGLEYVEIMREEQDDFTALNRFLNSIQAEHTEILNAKGLDFSAVKRELGQHEDFYYDFEDLSYLLTDFVLDANEAVLGERDRFITARNLEEHRRNLEEAGRDEQAAAVVIPEIDLAASFQRLKDRENEFLELNDEIESSVSRLLDDAPQYEEIELQDKIERFRELAGVFIASLPDYEERLANWDREASIGIGAAFWAFLTGGEWVTNSSIQDWYGLWPLFSGSLLVSFIAMSIAVPFGVGAAIYCNQVAGLGEQNLIKPFIEFISAIPSVVIGFFGIVIFGGLLRDLSETGAFAWISFFPMHERLTAFTAGALLALMAIPTIFTLAEDAINNVPKSFKEASLAMGATRLQTTIKIIVPTALSGIISAILLGFGRVIGETMVVLLCAGNRIAIPDFTQGLGAFFQPVHTMTGIIAQELGEVVPQSIHYRALFMVGMVLFIISLLINYFAQKIVIKFQISRG
ncbi:MAG: phosphate ABC transporter permease subunit PstC [Verrucomicrobiota bacterium]